MTAPALDVTLAKLAAILKILRGFIENPVARYFDPSIVLPYFESGRRYLEQVSRLRPELFDDLPLRPLPTTSGTSDFEGRGHVARSSLEELARDIDYVFEVRAASQASLTPHGPTASSSA